MDDNFAEIGISQGDITDTPYEGGGASGADPTSINGRNTIGITIPRDAFQRYVGAPGRCDACTCLQLKPPILAGKQGAV